MSDTYTQIATNPFGRKFVQQLGLPAPVLLERHEPGDPVVEGTVLLGAAPGGRLAGPIAEVLEAVGAQAATELRDDLRAAAADAGLDASVWNPAAPGDQKFKALVFDATGITDSTQLNELHAFFQPSFRRVRACGRVIVLGTPVTDAASPREATAQRALEGFVRSAAKEARDGTTAQLVYVAPGAEDQLRSTLAFLLSPRSAYVSGQVVRIGKGDAPSAADLDRPLEGKVVLVTGAARGIGAAIARTLARDGATVVGLDVPALSEDLEEVVGAIGGTAIEADITAADAPTQIGEALKAQHGGVDVVVHNAGITRDKTIGGMKPDQWEIVLDVNLSAQERLNDVLLATDTLHDGGRIVCVSSISGIAGNNGQTNYATSKAGVIGMVQSLAPVLAERNITINAVAPGFIETKMTAKVPLPIRQAGRLMNSMSQGGQPVDVAETIGWFASPGSAGLTGNVVRVCGQSLLGA